MVHDLLYPHFNLPPTSSTMETPLHLPLLHDPQSILGMQLVLMVY